MSEKYNKINQFPQSYKNFGMIKWKNEVELEFWRNF